MERSRSFWRSGFVVGLVCAHLCLTGSARAQDRDATGENPFRGFSGKSSPYMDDLNGFKIKIPAEFNLHDKGFTTDWLGPILDGGSVSFSVNAVEMKGVPAKILYETNLKSYQDKSEYTEVTPVKVKLGDKTVLAFRCKEADKKPGTRDLKAPDDLHRWHLFVFGNQRFYTCGFCGQFATFQAKKVQAVFEEILKSVELVPVKP